MQIVQYADENFNNKRRKYPQMFRSDGTPNYTAPVLLFEFKLTAACSTSHIAMSRAFSAAFLGSLSAASATDRLLLPESIGFWNEHSDRAGLDS